MNRLLDSLHIGKVYLVGHSMGGMLAARFAMLYPGKVQKLVLEDPIGLEDYKRFVPYQTIEQLTEKELNATYESYKKYQQSYYPQWKPEYEQYVQAQAEALNFSNTPLFRAPNSAVGNGSFGRITQQANFARMVQLGLRLFF